MPERTKEELQAIAENYKNAGEFARKGMRKKHKDIDFDKMLSEMVFDKESEVDGTIEFKGIGGGKVVIDGDNVHIKLLLLKENCTFADIFNVEYKEHNAFRFSVEISTTSENPPYEIIFNDSGTAMQLYELIIEKAPHANPFLFEELEALLDDEDMVALGEEVKTSKFCPECGTNAEGAKFCPECGASMTLGATKPSVATTTVLIHEEDDAVRCPKCNSTSLSANKRGFSVGKAVVGTLLLAGPLVGAIGAKKIQITCLKCGKQFMAGKG